ncbi:MAG TPA: SBBP repeat-containing protein [Bryobacteraceae bacterium]|nr:SBBP repeat-containing protein [Bryobacteraceae bacterium]
MHYRLLFTALLAAQVAAATPAALPRTRDWVVFHPEPGSNGHSWVARAPGFRAWFGNGRVRIATGPAETLAMELRGSNAGTTLEGIGGHTAINRIHGSEPVAAFDGRGGLLWRNVYEGIDLVFAGSGGFLKSEFRLAPNTDPRVIRFRYPGHGTPKIDGDHLIVAPATGNFRELRPHAWQESQGSRTDVGCGYRVEADGTVGFWLGKYDPALPLVIDPQMEWSTIWGGSLSDAITGITTGADGSVYATGWTESADLISATSFATRKAGVEAFVVKVTPAGALAWATYLGGSGYDKARAIAVDASGNVWITGQTDSRDFPLRSAFQQILKAGHDAFVAKLDPNGTGLLFSTYFGGASTDTAAAIAIDTDGAAFVAGETSSADFPAVNAFQAANRGGTDAFVAKFMASGALVYSTYLGGSGVDRALAVAARNGEATIAGSTTSANLPLKSPLQSVLRGGQDAFIARLSAAGAPLVYSTYLGGTGTSGSQEVACAITVNSTGEAYVAGTTNSRDFPVSGAFQPALAGGGNDAFIAKLNAGGSALIWSTFLGGLGSDKAEAISLDPSGNVYLAGTTWSSDLPLARAIQTTKAGQSDAFVASLDGGGTKLRMCTYIGGTAAEGGSAVAAAADFVVIAGQTQSPDMPLRNQVQSWTGGAPSGFITRISTADVGRSLVPRKVGVFRGGQWYVDLNGDGNFDSSDRIWSFGLAGDLPVMADWNGDGRFKIGIWRNGSWYVDYNGDGTFNENDRIWVFGLSGDIPVVADWNGDGRQKIGIWRGGSWYVDYNGDGTFNENDRIWVFGLPGDVPVVADWNGDGRQKIGIWRNGSWYIDYNGDGTFNENDRIWVFGLPGDIPVLGDWNGDGRIKIGIWRNGAWYIDYNGDGTFNENDRIWYFGLPGDIPVVGDWQP